MVYLYFSPTTGSSYDAWYVISSGFVSRLDYDDSGYGVTGSYGHLTR